MKRRDFFKSAALAGISTFFQLGKLKAAPLSVQSSPDLVAIMGGEPDVMLIRALKELGGIKQFVKSGQKVVIKPNIGWDEKARVSSKYKSDIGGYIGKNSAFRRVLPKCWYLIILATIGKMLRKQ